MFPSRKKQVFTIAITLFGILFIFTLFATRIRLNPKKICTRFGDLLYINQTTGNGTCFPGLSQGPCPSHMILTPIPNNNSFGGCVCDNTKEGRRVLLYHRDTKKCYPVFTQGFCKPDEWVTMSPRIDLNGGVAICTPNICLNQIISGSSRGIRNNFVEWVPLIDGSCAILGTMHESCPQNQGDAQQEEEVIRFFKQKLYPACTYKKRKDMSHRDRTIFGGPGVSIPPTDCPEGYFKTELGCAVEFDAR